MSWSFRAIGTPENLSRAMDKECEGYSGDSRHEFEEAKRRVQLLLELNRSKTPGAMRLDASGSKWEGYSFCTVELTQLGGRLV